jgi:hypothetical protein
VALARAFRDAVAERVGQAADDERRHADRGGLLDLGFSAAT